VLDIMISAGQQGSCGKKDALVQSGLQARKCGQRWDWLRSWQNSSI